MTTPKLLGIIAAVLILGVLAGRFTAPRHAAPTGEPIHAAGAGTPGEAAAAATEYTCSMHPQIRQPNPGKCPICAMDLIPAQSQGSGQQGGPREITLTPHAKALARITTQEVERRVPVMEVRLFGRVVADETRQRSIAARFPGRIERLYVNYTGVLVKEGDHLAKIYSPELLTAQAELLSALKFNDARAANSAREKLRLWGFSDQAIAAVESRGEPSDRMDIDAPLGGFVTEKMVSEGEYVETGAELFSIADLSTVWVVLDAYELDQPWLRFGQTVKFTAEALPGREFQGLIAFIPPVLDPETRTFKVRVNIENDDLALRPGMFVTGVVQARLAGEGVLLDPSLKGKWISPMHPEIVKDAPGNCDICGMPLVKAEDLGYEIAEEGEAPLVVPASAVLRTGRRAIVYVELPDREAPTYEGREITLGPRAGDVYIVNSGLEAGERVVVNGAFKVDSSLQLQAKPSMMSATNENAAVLNIPVSPEMQVALGSLATAYYPIWKALAGDDHAAAIAAAAKLEAATHQHHEVPGPPKGQDFFNLHLAKLSQAAGELAKTADIDAARVKFEETSIPLITLARWVGLPEGMQAQLAFCPMAFGGRRADWLQDNRETLLNPYFGAAMLNCGEFEDLAEAPATPAPVPAAPAPAGHVH